MKKALVIGGFGNIGLGITKELVNNGYDVTVMSRSCAETNPVPEVNWIAADRLDVEGFKKAVKNGGYEYVIDLACHTKENAQEDYEAFPELKHLIVFSSGAAYGPLYGREIPIREDMKRQPNWIYGIWKKGMEDYFFSKVRDNNYPVTIFRPTVTYGRQKTIVRQIASDNSWIDRIRKGKPIVTGNPYILRNFLYVDDVPSAVIGAFKHEWCKGQVYNLGGLKPYDWGTYHTTMMKVLGREVDMVEVPLEVLKASPNFEVTGMITENFVYNGHYSNEKIARDIPEFTVKTDLEEGLRKTVAYLDENGLIPNSDEITWEDELIQAQKKAIAYFSNSK